MMQQAYKQMIAQTDAVYRCTIKTVHEAYLDIKMQYFK